MKQKLKKTFFPALCLLAALGMILPGCSNSDDDDDPPPRVYVAGYYYDGGDKPCYWLNGVKHDLDIGSGIRGIAYALAVAVAPR
jgi:hypothetical protein